MTDPIHEPLLDEETSSHVRWWVSASPGRDCYDLYVVRYEMQNSQVVNSHYYRPPDPTLDFPDAGWVEYNGYDQIEPAYRFPGEILHMFAHTEWLQRSRIEEGLREIAVFVFAEEAARKILSESRSTPTGGDDAE